MNGTVYLVGAGPGDPGLITVRGRELLEAADVVVYDALVDASILERAAGAERIFVGKRAGQHSLGQDEINRLLVGLAGRHSTIVRLKGGDPFVFGRGGEEALALAAANVPFEVVPGVTAGVAAPAYAGIPVTHRGLSADVTFATGHEDPDKATSDLDWGRLAGSGTVVFYMGVGKLADNLNRLRAAGRAPDTPAAAVEWGTYPRQRTVVATVETLPARAEAAAIRAPAVIICGAVVELREKLAWFERRPLFGRRIVVTRARAQASDFVRELRTLGAEAIEFPTIRIAAPSDGGAALRRAVAGASAYDWVVFTSVNGVDRFWAALRSAGLDGRALAGNRLCAIGPATSEALEQRGLVPDLIPERFVAESVIEGLIGTGAMDGARVLLPRAEDARETLPRALTEAGARVDVVPAYRTEPAVDRAEAIRRRLQEGTIDLISFTASSTVRNFTTFIGTEVGPAEVASIGPITSATARELGLPVHVEAEQYDIPGLLRAIVGHSGRV